MSDTSEQRIIASAERQRTYREHLAAAILTCGRPAPARSAALALLRAGVSLEPAAYQWREHAPIAERVRHRDTGRRGWLVASSDRGRLSLVLWRSATSEPARTSWHPTSATRLGWQS